MKQHKCIFEKQKAPSSFMFDGVFASDSIAISAFTVLFPQKPYVFFNLFFVQRIPEPQNKRKRAESYSGNKGGDVEYSIKYTFVKGGFLTVSYK